MQLKSKDGKQFAYLVQPDNVAKNDKELYASVADYGGAVIRPFEGATYNLLPLVALTPEQFESMWQGD